MFTYCKSKYDKSGVKRRFCKYFLYLLFSTLKSTIFEKFMKCHKCHSKIINFYIT